MKQILDNGNRQHTKFIIRDQSENLSGREGFCSILNAGRNLEVTLINLSDQIRLIHDTYGTKHFSIEIEE